MAAEPKIPPVACQPIVAGMVRLFGNCGLWAEMIDIIVSAGVKAFNVPALVIGKLAQIRSKPYPYTLILVYKMLTPLRISLCSDFCSSLLKVSKDRGDLGTGAIEIL
jgi:hypothetical protein